MSRRLLTPAAAMEIKRLYALQNQWGVPIHSQSEIAAMLGVSETTVFRAIHKRGAYTGVPEAKTDAEAKASEEAFRLAHPELFSAEGKMVAAVAAEKKQTALVDQTLSDLTGEGGSYDFVQRKDK